MNVSPYEWFDRNDSILVCLHTLSGEAKDEIYGKSIFKVGHPNNCRTIFSRPSKVAITFSFIVASATAITIAYWS